jgi:hypothetical protein
VIRIKDWQKFQHFKDRKPLWVKLYRDILDDLDWHELDAKAAKALVMMWLIASEDDGYLPDTKKLAFRLRMSETATLEVIFKLSHWLEQVDINVASTGYQEAIPETETETETETDIGGLFSRFWDAYPRKVAKPDALKAFRRTKPTEAVLESMLAAIGRQDLAKRVQVGEARFVPHPTTWLNQERWKDQEGSGGVEGQWWLPAGFTDRFEAENARCSAHNAHQFRDGKRIPEAA